MNTVEGLNPPGWFVEVLLFLTFPEQSKLIQSNKAVSRILLSTVWWRIQSEKCALHYQLYCPVTCPPSYTWKSLFQHLWQLKFLWSDQERLAETDQEDKSQIALKRRIKVFARFKPSSPGKGKSINPRIVLPLHQRIQLMKAGKKEIASTVDAIKELKVTGEWFQTANSNIETKINENQGEDKSIPSFDFRIQAIEKDKGEVTVVAPKVGMKHFKFSKVFNHDATQSNVFEAVGEDLLVDFMNGHNATLLAYGQTGSGKTYTMFGPEDSTESKLGCIPRMCDRIFEAIQKRKHSNPEIEYQIGMSYVEVFGDVIYDLLREGKATGNSQVSAVRYVLEGHAQVNVQGIHDVERLLADGELIKRTSSTKLNHRSSRAHSICIISLVQSIERNNKKIHSKIFLADLGGSERLKKSGASGVQVQEAININLGLLSLKKVISSLNKKHKFIPYHESKLTMLLSPGIGGNSRTKIVVCGSLDSQHSAETLNTLRFGQDCSNIRNSSKSNVEMVTLKIKEIDREIKSLQNEIKTKERWETKEILRKDDLVEKGTFEEGMNRLGGELVRTTVPVGAEYENARLEELYLERAKLLGE